MSEIDKSKIQKEILDSLPEHPHGRLLLAPRVGKSKLIIDIIKRDNPKSVLWVTPSAKLANEDIYEEFNKWKAKSYIPRVTTTTYASLPKYTGHYEMIVLDEEQYVTERNVKNLIQSKLYADYIVSMTGTPTKHFEKLQLYKKLNLRPLYTLKINTAVNMGLLSNYEVKVLEVDLERVKKVVKAGKKGSYFMQTESDGYAYKTKMLRTAMMQNRADKDFRMRDRMRFIKDSPSKLEAAKALIKKLKGRKLIFASTIKQAEALCKYTYHSKTDDTNLKKFQDGTINEIAMIDSGGVGYTYKEIDHLIMVQADSDRNGRTSQKICRTLLKQKAYKATVWIVSLMDTADEKWVASALENFDKSKVKYTRYKNWINDNKRGGD